MKNTLILFCLLFAFNSFAQQKERTLCIFDISQRNNETNDARLFSLEHMANVAGVPTIITDDINEAIKHAVIISTSTFAVDIFESEEKDVLADYASAGGVIIAPRVSDSKLFDLFGITEVVDSKTRYQMSWQITEQPDLFRWIDDEYEQTISIARSNQGEIFKSVAYELGTAKSLAKYDDGGNGMTMNAVGNGFTYAFGISWKELILRNQINRDYEAQRITSNGFEPTSDVLYLILRSIFNKHVPFSCWKHTAPRNATSTLEITHDVDSRTGMDSLQVFANHEAARGIIATYNITVRYLGDETMSDFYNGNEDAISYLIDRGHVIGSHSVGHFPDFGDDDIFPLGEKGIAKEDYSPFNDGEITSNGTLYGECGVSKDILEEEGGQQIRVFRAGHLVYNKYLVNVLDDLGYEFCTNYTTADVLTSFPYRNKKGRSFSGERSNILEIPLAISDVFHSDPISSSNVMEKVDIWEDILLKNDANHANTCLLIHPNRIWKNDGQEAFLDRVPSSVAIMEIGDYGDFWNHRTTVEFSSELEGNNLTITLNPASYQDDEQMSFIINNGQDLEKISFLDIEGNSLELTVDDWAENDKIAYIPGSPLSGNQNFGNNKTEDLKIYPNPALGKIANVEVNVPNQEAVVLAIYDILGKKIRVSPVQLNKGSNNIALDLKDMDSGIYFVGINGKAWNASGKLVVSH